MRPQVEELFYILADLPSKARAQYFAAHNIDPVIRSEVEDLARFDPGSSALLRQDIWQAAEEALARLEGEDLRCGPYRLQDLLGRGGMGAVYAAERVDGEVSHRVAVKLLKPGSNAPLMRERFLAERQILANLSHPNIAGLLDAGHRIDGQPYLVMEYVEGKPLDEYSAGLGVRQKISLFLKVCAAVAYLHRNLVVHRDLKPANILVTADGEPKLLDFGIAKLLDLTGPLSSTTVPILTPDYASPEQVCGQTVSTGSDIYSLGAVLYKVLTGVSPHQFAGDSASAIALAIADCRITPPSKLAPGVNRDLEMVVMKALRRETQERYATMEQFAEDLENYLKLRPIRARNGDIWYQSRKFLRRHWVPSAATILVISSLSTGLYVANGQRAVAERRFGQLQHLSRRVIDLDGAIRTLPGSVGARQHLVAASLEYLEGLSHEARGNLDIALQTAEGYWRMARIQGCNSEFNLGDLTNAELSLSKAERLLDTVLASQPRNRGAIFRLAVVSHDRMILAEQEMRWPDSVAHSRRAVGSVEKLLATVDPLNPVYLEGFLPANNGHHSEQSAAALIFAQVAQTYVNMHIYADAARFARRAAEIARPIADAQALTSQSLSILANALCYQGDTESSVRVIREARNIFEKASFSSETMRFFGSFGLLLREGFILGEVDAVNLERPREAADALGLALKITDEAARKDPRDAASRFRVANAARELGDILLDSDPRRALQVFDLGMQRLGETPSELKTQRDRAAMLAKSSYALHSLRRPSTARKRLEEAFAILKETKDYPTERIPIGGVAATAVASLADYQAAEGEPYNAVKTYEHLLKGVLATSPNLSGDLQDTLKLSRIYRNLAGLYSRIGDTANAGLIASRRVELWSYWDQKLPQNRFVRKQLAAARLN